MRHYTGTYILIALLAGLTTGAVEPKPEPVPIDQEEYLDADDWFRVGLALNSGGRYQEAMNAFARSISIAPDNALSWLNLGTAQALTGDYDSSVESLRKSVELNPKLTLAYSNLAEVCFRSRRFPEAIEAYHALLALSPNNANALYKLGLSYLFLNNPGKAQVEYLSLKLLDPELAEKLRQAINQGKAQQ
jgi:tetratricopeptide (TPR) repeat protein